MIRRIFLLAFLLPTALCGQDSLVHKALMPRMAVKASPLHLFNFYPSVQLAYEQRLGRRITAQLDAGYVFDYRYPDESFRNKRGVKLKLEGRYYLWGSVRRKIVFYGAGEAYWNAVNFDRSASEIRCFDLDCQNQYRIVFDYTMEYREHGGTLKMGFVKYISSHFFFDINTGWTIRAVRYHAPEGIGDRELDSRLAFLEYPNEEDRIALSPNLGIRIGYRIR